jgi:hypothetical protein
MSHDDPIISSESSPDLESEMLVDIEAAHTESKNSDQAENEDKTSFDKLAQRRKKAAPVGRTKLDVEACRDMASKTLSGQESRLREQLESREPEPVVPLQPIENFRMATHCPASWEKMTGSGCVKFCETCKLQAYDFSGMNMPEVQELILKREDKKKFVLYKRKDGKFLTADCPVGIQKKRTLILASTAGALLVLGVFYLLITQPPPQVVNPAAADESVTSSGVKAENTSPESPANGGAIETSETPMAPASETDYGGMPLSFPAGAPQVPPQAQPIPPSADQTPTSPAPATTSTDPTATPPTPAAAAGEQSSQASTSDASSIETSQPNQQHGVWQRPAGQ